MKGLETREVSERKTWCVGWTRRCQDDPRYGQCSALSQAVSHAQAPVILTSRHQTENSQAHAQLTTLPFHDRVAAIGAKRSVVLPRRSGRVFTWSARLTLLSDPLVSPRVLTHTEREPEQPEPSPHASSTKSTTTSHPVGQPPEAEGAHDQTGNDLGTRGEGSARPPRPSELPVAGDRTCHPVVTKYSSLDQDAGSRPAIGQGQASSRGGTSEQEGLADAELSKYLVDDQNLLWLECECVGVSARKTSVLAVPQCLVPDLSLIHI